MPLRGVGLTGRRFDLEQKSSFIDGHYLRTYTTMWHNYCFNFILKQKSLRRHIMDTSRPEQQIFIDPVCLMKVAPDKKDFTFTYKNVYL